MPEPGDLAAQCLDLLGIRNRVSPGNPVSIGKHARFVYQHLPLTTRLREVAGPANRHLPFRAVGQDEEDDARDVEILDEQRLAQPAHKRLAPGHEAVVGIVGNDHANVQVRPFIGRAGGVGAVEGGGEDVGVGLAGGGEAVEDELMVSGRPFLAVHSVSPPVIYWNRARRIHCML